MATIFTKIINREIPAHIVAEDDSFIAFLDVRPLQKGHTLIVPKQEIDFIFDIEADTLAEMMKFAQKVAKGMRKVLTCKRIGVAVLGLEVPHAHIHLVPLTVETDIAFNQPRLHLSQEEYAEIAASIKNAI